MSQPFSLPRREEESVLDSLVAQLAGTAEEVQRWNGLVSQRLSADWQAAYGHPIAAVESFVDRQRFRGTAYKAGNWTVLGQTDGFQRMAEDFYVRHDCPKQLWVKSLVAEAPDLLCAGVLPAAWQAYDKPPPVEGGVSCEHLPSLFERLATLDHDPPNHQGPRLTGSQTPGSDRDAASQPTRL